MHFARLVLTVLAFAPFSATVGCSSSGSSDPSVGMADGGAGDRDAAGSSTGSSSGPGNAGGASNGNGTGSGAGTGTGTDAGSSGGASGGSSGSTMSGEPFGCTIDMPIQGAANGTLDSVEACVGSLIAVDAPPPYSSGGVTFTLPTPAPMTTGHVVLAGLAVSLYTGGVDTEQKFVAPEGACTVTIEQIQVGASYNSYKGSGSCSAPAVLQPSSTAADAGAADGSSEGGSAAPPAATLTIGNFTFAF